jgi:hypothetical protein
MNNNKFKRATIFLIAFLLVTLGSSKASVILNDNGDSEDKPKIDRHFVFDTVPMNLEEITQDAEKIFAGECKKIEEIENDKESKLPVIKYTFKVTEGLKGIGENKEISFKQWKPTVNNAGYDVGKNYILFLYPESERGLTSPVGFLQGQFEVDSKGFFRRNKVVKNKTNNKGLYKNPRNKKIASLKKNTFLKEYISNCSELGIPIRYKEFTEAVKELAGN